MNPLRRRMIEDMQLRNLSLHTQRRMFDPSRSCLAISANLPNYSVLMKSELISSTLHRRSILHQVRWVLP